MAAVEALGGSGTGTRLLPIRPRQKQREKRHGGAQPHTERELALGSAENRGLTVGREKSCLLLGDAKETGSDPGEHGNGADTELCWELDLWKHSVRRWF